MFIFTLYVTFVFLLWTELSYYNSYLLFCHVKEQDFLLTVRTEKRGSICVNVTVLDYSVCCQPIPSTWQTLNTSLLKYTKLIWKQPTNKSFNACYHKYSKWILILHAEFQRLDTLNIINQNYILLPQYYFLLKKNEIRLYNILDYINKLD